MVKSLMIDSCLCSIKWLSFRKAIKLTAKPCPHGASPPSQVCPRSSLSLANEAIMRCQLGLHDQSKKRLVLFFQEKSAVFSETVFRAGRSSCWRCSLTSARTCGEGPPLQLGKRPRWAFVGQPWQASAGPSAALVTGYPFRSSANKTILFSTSALPSKFLLSPALINLE